MDKFKLCFVKNSFAYFTSQDLSDQWGDDWDDRPYELNAGEPYSPCWHNEKGSRKRPCHCEICQRDWIIKDEKIEPRWEIKQVGIDTKLVRPSHGHRNSPFSVGDINERKKVPWLRDPCSDHPVEIFAGETIHNFIEKVEHVDGQIFLDRETWKQLD